MAAVGTLLYLEAQHHRRNEREKVENDPGGSDAQRRPTCSGAGETRCLFPQ